MAKKGVDRSEKKIRITGSPDRKFAIIAAVATLHKPTLRDLEQATGIPGVSLRRLIISIRNELSVDLLFVPDNTVAPVENPTGKQGYYTIQDWGVLNKRTFLEKHKPDH